MEPTGQSFILHPIEHSSAAHTKTSDPGATTATNVKVNKFVATPKSNVSKEQSSICTSKSGSAITVKYISKIKLMNFCEMLDPKATFGVPYKDSLNVWSKMFSLTMIHIGVKKPASSNSSIEF